MQRLIETSMQRFGKRHQNRPFASEIGLLGSRRIVVSGLLAVLGMLLSGCATQGDFLSLQEKVAEHHTPNRDAPDPFARIAKLNSEVDAMRQEMRNLKGELEIARRESSEALEEVRRTRTALAAQGAATAATGAAGAAGGVAQGATGSSGGGGTTGAAAIVSGGDSAPEPDQELVGYQAALDARREGDLTACIERFTAFLQAYPTSGYADDAAYWLADCTYKNDEFKRAVVRFNAVVSVYPESPKAPDALYRQGESLLKLGPKFHEAARTVFKRVQKDYPDSERAVEAEQQLERLGTGNQSG
jgi:tol-pal system protein YbgF